ncbi:breast carcinoma-amplified sequence 4 isoform X2 [Spea bombifrons]|uniref:breast carcinoma-amplified sequence 4 isoform X2 n=1 Tax=Spea bombifrons TaxID=233779 RepID=UPI00234AEBE3|nr:breast carcinoma-amplified sequence 4 isoform X2 [Spea bombifrons]
MRGRSRLLRRNEAGEGRVEERATEQQGETVRKETQRGTWEQGMTEMEDLENSIEDMLVRLDEFCAMMDMIRNETSHILEEKIPALTIKVEEMNKIYSRVDKLEAFVKMVGHHVTFLEEEVAQAESDHLSFPQALNRMIQGAPIPLLLRKKASKPPKSYELPKLYRTEDYFPPHYIYVKNEKSYQILPSGL